MSHDKGNVVQYLFSVDGLGDSFYRENLITDFAVGTEVNIRIFTAGGLDFIQLDFFKGTLSAGCLLGFTCVCREAGDKFL